MILVDVVYGDRVNKLHQYYDIQPLLDFDIFFFEIYEAICGNILDVIC